jgi:hypothetical protein
LYSSPNTIIAVTCPRRMPWAENVAHMRKLRNAYIISISKLVKK